MNHGRFLTKKTLGRGAFGTTYLAYDRISKHDVALKVVELKNENDARSAADEISTLKGLSNYPSCNKYIVCLYDSFIEIHEGVNKLFLISEYIDGVTLQDYIRSSYISFKTLTSVIYGLVAGLLYIHDNEYAHGDIKPDNIIITTDGRVKYIDFGLACTQKCIDSSSECSNPCSRLTLMSALYASPDYYRSGIRNLKVAQANDIWSLGVVLYQLINKNALPFDYDSNPKRQKENILNAPKYESHSYYLEVNEYVDSFLINDYRERPNIKTQYEIIADIIHRGNTDSVVTNNSSLQQKVYESEYINW